MSAATEPRWRRVFGRSETVPSLDALCRTLHAFLPQLEGRYRADATGWTEAAFEVPSTNVGWLFSRYTRADDDIRGELQSWAAWVETCTDNPHRQMLMEHITATQQVFVFEEVEPLPEGATSALCRWLAQATEGLYQLDGAGFFTAEGDPLGFVE